MIYTLILLLKSFIITYFEWINILHTITSFVSGDNSVITSALALKCHVCSPKYFINSTSADCLVLSVYLDRIELLLSVNGELHLLSVELIREQWCSVQASVSSALCSCSNRAT